MNTRGAFELLLALTIVTITGSSSSSSSKEQHIKLKPDEPFIRGRHHQRPFRPKIHIRPEPNKEGELYQLLESLPRVEESSSGMKGKYFKIFFLSHIICLTCLIQ